MLVKRKSENTCGTKPSQPSKTVCCKVLGITERASTHPPAPAAHIAEQALAYIETHAKEGIGPGDVARHLNISRRLLDMRFHEYNALYRSLGFSLRETNVYTLDLQVK